MSTKKTTSPKKSEKKASAAPKPAAEKASAKPAKKKLKGIRYSTSQKADIVQFVNDTNASQGRGGVAAATRKFKVSPITINNWIKKSGAPATPKKTKAKSKAKAAKAPKAPKASSKKAGTTSLTATLNRMTIISAQIESLQAEFDSLKASL